MELINRIKQDPLKLSMMKDYLNVANNPHFQKLLSKEKEETLQNGFCLSDHVYTFDSKTRRNRSTIVITEKSLYIFTRSHKPALLCSYTLEDLEEVVLSSQDFTLFLLRFSNSSYILLDSYRRVDIVLYISQLENRKAGEMFQIIYLRSFKLKKRKNNNVDLKKARATKKMLPAY